MGVQGEVTHQTRITDKLTEEGEEHLELANIVLRCKSAAS